ncbi:MAG: PIN domain-containing protein [Rhodoferax sp.]|jgi:toxin-antitoxin system PIN domain toxin|nr:PIN domain-containing protein [Rhodoferax sp.]
MKLPDTNVLVHSVNEASPCRPQASHWLEQAFDSGLEVGFAWLALVSFVRISTQRAILPTPLTVADALGLVDDWLTHPSAKILQPTVRHADILARLLLLAGCAGNLTHDAHLAALAIEHGAVVGTFDRDFKKFPGVKFDLLT